MNPPSGNLAIKDSSVRCFRVQSRLGSVILPFVLAIKTTDPNKLSHRKWCHIADKIELDPGLLAIPLGNIERWTKDHRDGVAMLLKWKTLIEAAQSDRSAFEQLLTLLRADDEGARHLKSYSPFPGVLTSAEVDLYTCGWRH